MVFVLITYSILLFVLLIYLLYPTWLAFGSSKEQKTTETNLKDVAVSVVLLSFNGGQMLFDKALVLLEQLSKFKNSELIIIDDCSNDNSISIIEKNISDSRIKIIKKCEQKGIPDSMNAAVKLTKNEIIIFSDQRQKIPHDSIENLVKDLLPDDVGAVSSCISSVSKDNCFSLVRMYENSLKTLESRTGSLIGVYGPLYGIKKTYYKNIPEDIILDDLYLSMRILSKTKIVFARDCAIVDENLNRLFDYQRVKRYCKGFMQIMKEIEIIKELSFRHKTMLIWHKYLRLVLPFLFIFCIAITGLYMLESRFLLILFISSIILLIYSLIPRLPQFSLTKILRINLFYFFAFFNCLYDYIFKTKVN